MRSEILRSTPFRLTVILGTAFFAALALAGLIAFGLIERELNQRMDRSITDTFNVISQSFGDSDLTDLTDTVRSHASATLDHDRIYALIDASGVVLAGNVARAPSATGWMTLSATELGLVAMNDEHQYRVFVGEVGRTHLLIGASFAETTDIARLTLTSVGWASGAILVLVLATGSIVAIRAQRRIDGIAETMSRIGHGELNARIPVGVRGDDIDMLARQVNVALDRLASLVEGMRQVSVNIAHDLKTPLNRLAITVEAAIEIELRGESVAPLLEQAEVEIQQINSTFDALLRIAQIEAGARRARFVPVQLTDVLDKIADVYSDVAEESEQTLSVSHDDDLPRIEGDSDLLIQLCANLVENSIRYSPAETHIEIRALRSGDGISLTFDDDGPGIPIDERSKVFQRLYRIEQSRTRPGNGLGLSLVKAVAELHGARIELGDNDPGLRVSIWFPVPSVA
jgi:signal transduction histidine kinase